VLRRALAVGLVAMMSCRGKDGPGGIPVRDVSVTAPSTSLLVGSSTQLAAQVTGTDGNALEGARVTWTSVTPSILGVSPAGVATALQAGQGVARAVSGGVAGDLSILVRNPPVAAIAFDRDSAVIALPSGSVTLVPAARDSSGRTIVNPTFFYSSSATRIATVTQLGVVTAVAAGTAVISASADDVSATVRVRVTAAATATSPQITGVTPMVAGASAVVSGKNFASSAGGNAVLVEGIPAMVTAATTTQLTIALPSSGWACSASLPVTLQVNANNEIGVAAATLRTAIARTLAVGQSLVLSSASDARCNELANTGGAYLVTTYNAARAQAGSEAAFQLHGAATASRTLAAVAATPGRAIVTPPFARWQEMQRDERAIEAHTSLMQRSLAFARSAGSPRSALNRLRASVEGALPAGFARANQVATLGAITPLKIPNYDAPSFCSSSIPVGARTAWVGKHAVIVEDTTSMLSGALTLAGQLDSTYAQLGREFDDVMWPILTQSFGNPLAMDDNLSRTGKIVMLFSQRINTMAGGQLAGFVVSCDFFPVSTAPSSNFGEYFYAYMPTSLAAGAGANTRDAWLRQMRSTIIHEAKHITSYGERIARAGSQTVPYEALWLEEGLARHAEELYARTIYGVTGTGNTGYAASVFCDLHLTTASQCLGRPILMIRHFDALYQYLRSPEPYTVLGWVSGSDGTFYATAWSMVRWMMDQYASTPSAESAFLKALVQTTSVGVANLEARVPSHPWEEMFGEWALALYADDFPGVSFANPRLQFRSWNLRDVFLGMCSDRGLCAAGGTSTLYPVAFPLAPHAVSFGEFSQPVDFLNSGTFTSWLLSGPQSAPQLLELKGAAGGEPPAQLRLAIVRLQ